MGLPNCERSMACFCVISSTASSAPAICTERSRAPPRSSTSAPRRPGSGACASTGALSNCRLSRGSPAAFDRSNVCAASLTSSTTTVGSGASATPTTTSTSRPHGTAARLPLTRPPRIARPSPRPNDSLSSTGANPAWPSSQLASIASGRGAGAPLRPQACNTPNRSCQVAPAPPSDSGTAASAKPDSAMAVHNVGGQAPWSQASRTCGVAYSASRRSTDDSRSSRIAIGVRVRGR